MDKRYASAHANPQGAGDARPTASQVIEDNGLMDGGLAGRVFLVTGGTSGIGVETVRSLHKAGADVYMPARNMEKGKKVASEILEGNSGSSGKLEVLEMDMNSLQSVRDCAAAFLAKSSRLNCLICNAGIMGTPEGQTQDGFELQFGTNHLAHFLLFELVKPALLAAASPDLGSRVVMLTSIAHRRAGIQFDDFNLKTQGYDPWVAYGQAKTANIYMAKEIERRYGAQGLHANAAHPGGIMTGLQVHVDQALMDSWKEPEAQAQFKNTEQGAATTIVAAIDKSLEGKGGNYLEDCSVVGFAAPEGAPITQGGYGAHIPDATAAERLWEESVKMVNNVGTAA